MFCLMISFVWVCIVLGVAVMCFLVVGRLIYVGVVFVGVGRWL